MHPQCTPTKPHRNGYKPGTEFCADLGGGSLAQAMLSRG